VRTTATRYVSWKFYGFISCPYNFSVTRSVPVWWFHR